MLVSNKEIQNTDCRVVLQVPRSGWLSAFSLFVFIVSLVCCIISRFCKSKRIFIFFKLLSNIPTYGYFHSVLSIHLLMGCSGWKTPLTLTQAMHNSASTFPPLSTETEGHPELKSWGLCRLFLSICSVLGLHIVFSDMRF